ncbi:MAG: winged helix-turn-helix transcriptional regulator [Nitrospiraceae bacterium]|nr:MAG: winged helix-turn-helix transcriptional regulator [Nitrospiraceae bacterium]
MRFYKYTPALLDPKTLEDTLIGRDLELDNIKRILKSASSGKSFSHPVLIGPKGIGKSHMLRIIYYGVKGEIKAKGINAFKNKFVPVILSEEEYPGNVTKFFKLALQYLKESNTKEIPPIPEELMKAVTLNVKEREIALDYIKTFRKKSGKILLLLVDNLNDILERFTSEDQSAMRDLLMTCDSLLLIGAAPTLFDSIINHDKPLYNFFEIIWLKDLPFDETILLLNKYAELGQRKDLLEKFKKEEAKLRAIHELAGGNPRLILSLYHIIVEGDITSVENTFLKLLDELSPYFRERMKDLSEQQKEIIDVMARAEGLLTPTEIAGRCYMPVNIVLSQIKRLERAGYIKISKKHARKVFYDFNERLFSLWRQMRVEAGRKRLGFIVRFLELWFTKDELIEEFRSTVDKIYKLLLKGDVDRMKLFGNKLWYIGEAASKIKPRIKEQSEEVLKIISDVQEAFKEISHQIEANLTIATEGAKTVSVLLWQISKLRADEADKANEVSKELLSIIMNIKNIDKFLRALSVIMEVIVIYKQINSIKCILHELSKLDRQEILAFLSPYLTLVKYLETKDPEIIDRLRHEERIVIEDMIRIVEGKAEAKTIGGKIKPNKKKK